MANFQTETVQLVSKPEVLTPQTLVNEPYSLLDSGSYACNFCGKLYKQIGSLKKHLLTNHEIEDLVSFRCKKCNNFFETQKKLSRHENMKSDCTKLTK